MKKRVPDSFLILLCCGTAFYFRLKLFVINVTTTSLLIFLGVDIGRLLLCLMKHV